jgi:hypothetical protein
MVEQVNGEKGCECIPSECLRVKGMLCDEAQIGSDDFG